MSEASDNRRRERRYQADLAVELRQADGRPICRGSIRNLSPGGFLAVLDRASAADWPAVLARELRTDTPLEACVQMQMEPRTLALRVVVRWCTERYHDGLPGTTECGVQLLELDTERRRVWHYLVKSFHLRYPRAPAFDAGQPPR